DGILARIAIQRLALISPLPDVIVARDDRPIVRRAGVRIRNERWKLLGALVVAARFARLICVVGIERAARAITQAAPQKLWYRDEHARRDVDHGNSGWGGVGHGVRRGRTCGRGEEPHDAHASHPSNSVHVLFLRAASGLPLK